MKLTEAQAWAAIGDMLYADAAMPRVSPSLQWCIDDLLLDRIISNRTCSLMNNRAAIFESLGFSSLEWEPRAMLCWLWSEVAENE